MNPGRLYLLSLLALGACSFVDRSPVVPDVEAPESWGRATSAEGAVPDAWWKSFDDPRLASLIDEAVTGNRSLRALAERVWVAEARARIAGAELWPRVSAGLGAQRQKQVFVGFPSLGGGNQVLSRTFTSYGVSLDVTWELDLWGRLRAGSDAATAEFLATVLDQQAARLSLASQTSKAWFALCEAKEQLDLSQRTVDSWRQTLEIVEDRYQGGTRPALDVRLTRSTLLGAEADLKLRGQLFESAKRQIELLLGRYPAAEIEAAAMPDLPPPVPVGVPAEILDRRPDLRAERAAVLASRGRVGAAKGALYPRIALTGSAGTVGNELEDLLDGDFSVWSLVGNIVQPIFQGGRLSAAVDLAEAEERAALSRFADAVLVAFGEVESSLAAESWLKEQREAVAALVAESGEATRIARERYQRGRGTLLDLLAAERSLTNAESRLIALRRLLLQARVDLHVAIGGGFPPTDAPETRRANGANEP